ncbi:MAG: PAS domain S-box protein [Blastocatellia bacterium]
MTAQPGLAPALAALDGEDDAIVVVDIAGTIVLMNVAAEKLFGVSADDMVGEYHELLVPDGMQWGHQAYRRGYFAEPSPRWMDPGLHPHTQRPDGTLIPISVWLEPRQIGDALFVVAHVAERDE